jgi:hypothetical protein
VEGVRETPARPVRSSGSPASWTGAATGDRGGGQLLAAAAWVNWLGGRASAVGVVEHQAGAGSVECDADWDDVHSELGRVWAYSGALPSPVAAAMSKVQGEVEVAGEHRRAGRRALAGSHTTEQPPATPETNSATAGPDPALTLGG